MLYSDIDHYERCKERRDNRVHKYLGISYSFSIGLIYHKLDGIRYLVPKILHAGYLTSCRSSYN